MNLTTLNKQLVSELKNETNFKQYQLDIWEDYDIDDNFIHIVLRDKNNINHKIGFHFDSFFKINLNTISETCKQFLKGE